MKVDKEHRYVVIASDYTSYGRFEPQKLSGPYDADGAIEAAKNIVLKHEEHEMAEVFPLGGSVFSVHVPGAAWEKAHAPELEGEPTPCDYGDTNG